MESMTAFYIALAVFSFVLGFVTCSWFSRDREADSYDMGWQDGYRAGGRDALSLGMESSIRDSDFMQP